MSKSWQPYARHILDAIAKIRRIEARGDLTRDDVLYDAALRNLQTLSEATQLLPADSKAAFPAVPWREISGFRNILVHNYLGIDLDQIWGITQREIPALRDAATRRFGALPDT